MLGNISIPEAIYLGDLEDLKSFCHHHFSDSMPLTNDYVWL
jgi:hypothetical protein